ncbi:hypothetical protein PAPYR_6381 [Paratrimastix pyriformis]|uniref:Uncharacterized protein n=1 Tax=Paratrimastix pyriformis TaxID=342808 RepID=A0ABQ8UKI5_9EUKA|nr:hypothetical protein PAPYR_6381 [Paratrimastix pyriformis]
MFFVASGQTEKLKVKIWHVNRNISVVDPSKLERDTSRSAHTTRFNGYLHAAATPFSPFLGSDRVPILAGVKIESRRSD